jgi:hypothetical protein
MGCFARATDLFSALAVDARRVVVPMIRPRPHVYKISVIRLLIAAARDRARTCRCLDPIATTCNERNEWAHSRSCPIACRSARSRKRSLPQHHSRKIRIVGANGYVAAAIVKLDPLYAKVAARDVFPHEARSAAVVAGRILEILSVFTTRRGITVDRRIIDRNDIGGVHVVCEDVTLRSIVNDARVAIFEIVERRSRTASNEENKKERTHA